MSEYIRVVCDRCGEGMCTTSRYVHYLNRRCPRQGCGGHLKDVDQSSNERPDDLFNELTDALVEIAGLSGADWSDYAAAQVGTWDDVKASAQFRRDLLDKPEMLVKEIRQLREDYSESENQSAIGNDELRKALVEAVMPLEVLAGIHRTKPYREISSEFMHQVDRSIYAVREALAKSEASAQSEGQPAVGNDEGVTGEMVEAAAHAIAGCWDTDMRRDSTFMPDTAARAALVAAFAVAGTAPSPVLYDELREAIAKVIHPDVWDATVREPDSPEAYLRQRAYEIADDVLAVVADLSAPKEDG